MARHGAHSDGVLKAAKELGLHPSEDSALMWVAEHASHVDLPDEWTEFEDDDKNKVYYHAKKKVVTKQHPIIAKYKDYIEGLRDFQARSGTVGQQVRPHLKVVLNEVLNRCNRELPPVTPEIVERLAVLLNIDTAAQPVLTRNMKIAIEGYAEQQYDLALQAHQTADMESFLRDIRHEQVKLEVLSKPEPVKMCAEFPERPARVKCEQCKDFFSLEGFAQLHSSGKMKTHTTVKCEQTTCSMYQNYLATCEVDKVLYCDNAYREIAEKRPELRDKRKKILGGLACSEYVGRVAEVLCEDCSDLFCWEAFIEIHLRGNRRRHVPLRLDSEGQLFRAGQLLSPAETAALIDQARFAREGGEWLAFQDDQLNTYWYNLSNKETSLRNRYLS